MAPVIQVEHVSKKFSRNANAHLSYGLGDLYNHLLGRQPSLQLRKDEFLAVNDVSFSLEQGDTLALIGRNGSGKSTLLKMMNGLVKLDAGRIVMDGRVQALINLGAGFNGALSGMDNIYNSAALYGFTRKQTKAIADEIIDFAELEEFINSPFETYSSGMKARLGFAVSVYLKPNILLIDEILSVGDHAFQNKCHRRMQELKKKGVTIILVSHAHTQVIQLCKHALWLHKGIQMQLGDSKETVNAYLNYLEEQNKEVLIKKASPAIPISIDRKELALTDKTNSTIAKREPEKKNKEIFGPIYDTTENVKDLRVRILVNGKETIAFPVHSALTIEYEFVLVHPVKDLNVTLAFFREDGECMSGISTLNGDLLKHAHQGQVCSHVHIPDFNFTPGNYVLVLPVHEGHSYLYRNIVSEFVVLSAEKMTWGYVDFLYVYNIQTPSP